MSLMKTLAKVAIGVAVAKGASAMMNRQGGANPAGGAGLGGLLGGLAGGATGAAGTSGAASAFGGANSPGAPAQAGVQDMLGGLLGGAGGQAGALGGLGGMLEQLGGAGGAQGGLGGLLGGLAGAAGAGGALGGLAGALQPQGQAQADAPSFGQVLNSSFEQTPEPQIEPTADQEAAAGLMLRAMIQAAKSDGQLDAGEQEKLVGQMGGDVDAQEAAFLREEMQKPVDVQSLVADTPAGMGPQIYAMSLLAIDLDNQNEAQYLHQLAQGFEMAPNEVNDIHAQMGVPSLYS